MRYLVKFDGNWADECNVYGLAILTQIQYDMLQKYSKNLTWNFGTNEGWEDEDLSDDFSVISTDENVISTFDSTLNMTSYGFPSWGNFPDVTDAAYCSLYDSYIEIPMEGTVSIARADGSMLIEQVSDEEANEAIHADILEKYPEFKE